MTFLMGFCFSAFCVCREELIQCFVPGLRLGEGYGVNFWGAKGLLKHREWFLCWKSSVAFSDSLFVFLTNGHGEFGSWSLPPSSGGFQTA